MTVLSSVARSTAPVAQESPRLLAPVRAAVVGLSRSGLLHGAILSSVTGCELVGFCDPRPEARRAARGLGFRAPAFDRIEKLLDRTQPDAVWIAPQWPRRDETARLALEQGAAVFLDRPLATGVGEAEALVRIAEERGRALAVGHPTLFHPVFAHTLTVLSSGALGAAKRVRASMYVSRVFDRDRQLALAPPGSAGGVFAHLASDLLVLLIRALGAPASVRATHNVIYGPFEDELHAMMTLPSGADVGIDCSWSVPGYPRPATVIEMEAEDGRLLASDDALEIDLAAPRPGDPRPGLRMGHSDLPQIARFDLEGEALYVMDASFLAWVSGGPAPAHRAADVLESARWMDAIYRSARNGGVRMELEP